MIIDNRLEVKSSQVKYRGVKLELIVANQAHYHSGGFYFRWLTVNLIGIAYTV